jgi:hypothetical protein
VHPSKGVALKLQWSAFEWSRFSSASVEVSGTEATKSGKFCLSKNFEFHYLLFFIFIIFVITQVGSDTLFLRSIAHPWAIERRNHSNSAKHSV